MNEADTRAELIDPALASAGWSTSGDVRVRREYRINEGEIKSSGIRMPPSITDYLLEYKGIPLAVIEAKSDELDVSEGVKQAKVDGGKLRLATSFAANGKQIYQIDLKGGTEGLIDRWPTPEELWERTFGESNEWLTRFSEVPFEDSSRQPRYYQQLAINRALESIANGENRVLLTLATGTGKTFIASQIAWKLFKSKWNQQRDAKRAPRILFLADRNILANQAYLDFTAFSENAKVRIEPSEISKRGQVPKNGSIFFTIFQTFMSGSDSQKYFQEYEEDFFDLIIIDECHRGGANDESNWRGILDHFSSATHLGLTATPKREDNADTYAYFGDPVFTYSLKEGIQDGFLTPFKVKRIQTTLDEYIYTPDDEVLEGEVEEGHVYTESDFNRKIVIEERERIRVREMLAHINPSEKTIVFCANQAHAAMVRDMINQESDNNAADYCVRVTANDGAQGDIYLKQFQDNQKSIPTILTTSQKLSTGVDARNVRNIVLMRPVNSMIEFKQIIGRGTRLFEGKNFFTIVDFVNASHLFSDPDWDGEPLDPPETPPRQPGEETPPVPGVEVEPDPDAPPRTKTKIKLSDGKTRTIQTMSSTYFYVDGKPVNAEQFLKHLFDRVKLPDLLGSEEELRKAWSNPLTRRDLLKKLQDAGCPKDDLRELQKCMEIPDCDLFDVLEFIAYAKAPVTRAHRAAGAQSNIHTMLNETQREFVDYVLRNYVQIGIDELDIGKLSTVLSAKYGSTHAAQQELGTLKEIQSTFIDFQKHLYTEDAA